MSNDLAIADINLLMHLRKKPDVREFIGILSPVQLHSLASLVSWPPRILSRVLSDPDYCLALHRALHIMHDRERFACAWMDAIDTPEYDSNDMMDAFSMGQLRSKTWLVQTLKELDVTLGNTWILCGWIGLLAYLLLQDAESLGLKALRSFDIDKRCAAVAERLNQQNVKDSWFFKATTQDVLDLGYDGFEYETMRSDGTNVRLVEAADTVINTSTEHLFDSSWFDRIPKHTTVVLQNNNLDTVDEHVNNVENEIELLERYPLGTVLFSGRLNCGLYHRFMIIGKK